MGAGDSRCCGKDTIKIESYNETSGLVVAEQNLDDTSLTLGPKVEEAVKEVDGPEKRESFLTRQDTPLDSGIDDSQTKDSLLSRSLEAVAEEEEEAEEKYFRPSEQEEERLRKEEQRRQAEEIRQQQLVQEHVERQQDEGPLSAVREETIGDCDNAHLRKGPCCVLS
mmetsp:Transcript_68008/g.107867  ORF Transcript_68008/g.107867 Transcript_68008/m.107867 type:complete len:167 (-) Transcript_68008:26-526(-)